MSRFILPAFFMRPLQLQLFANNRLLVFIFLIALVEQLAGLLMSSCLLNLSTSDIIIPERKIAI